MDETVNQATETTEERTFKQAEVDQIVGERLARERAKYADYDALKEKAGRLDALEESQKTELQKANERASAAEAELASLKREAEIREIREKVARETGVPSHLLHGETEEECTAQATEIKSFASPKYPTVDDHGELQNRPGGSTMDQFAAWLSQT